MKRIYLLLLSIAGGSCIGYSADFKSVLNNGNEAQVQDVKKILFDDNGITVQGKTTLSLGYNEFTSFSFTESAANTGIENVSNNQFTFDGNTVSLSNPATISVYDISGLKQLQATNCNELSVSELSSGVYFVEVLTTEGTHVYKIRKN